VFEDAGMLSPLSEILMTSDEIKETSRAFMQRSGESTEDVAHALHPDMTADDVTRYLAGEPPIDEDGRGFKVDEVMAEFAASIEEIEEEHSNDLA
jgi:hypothetical protein